MIRPVFTVATHAPWMQRLRGRWQTVSKARFPCPKIAMGAMLMGMLISVWTHTAPPAPPATVDADLWTTHQVLSEAGTTTRLNGLVCGFNAPSSDEAEGASSPDGVAPLASVTVSNPPSSVQPCQAL